jgi:hypothetical protein
MRVGEFALERLVADCLNAKEGKTPQGTNALYGTGKKRNRSSSTPMVDPRITTYNKKELQNYVKTILAQGGKEWKHYSPEVTQSRASVEVLTRVAGQAGLEMVLGKSEAKTQMEYIMSQDMPWLRVEVKKMYGKGFRESRKQLQMRVFCGWWQSQNEDCISMEDSVLPAESGEGNIFTTVSEEEDRFITDVSVIPDSDVSVIPGSIVDPDEIAHTEEMSQEARDVLMTTYEDIEDDKRLITPAMKKLAKIFHDLRLPLKFSVDEDFVVKLGRYSGKQMRKILANAESIFGCSELRPTLGQFWKQFYDMFETLSHDPPEGSSHHQVASQYQKDFSEWKENFMHQAGYLKTEWRIYLHILENHAADYYLQLGSLQPWSNEAGEHLHALDRMFVHQRRRRRAADLCEDVLVSAIRVRQSHLLAGNMQVASDIPADVLAAKPNSTKVPTILPLSSSNK